MNHVDQQYLDDMKRQEYQRQIDKKSDDFETIRLSRKEYKLLSAAEKDFIKVTSKNRSSAYRLQTLNLIKVLRSCNEHENIEICEIRERGVNYLFFYRGKKSERKEDYAHEWRMQIFSAVAGAFLSRPLWDGIDWVIKLLSTLSSK